ncbi:hypothetical protein IAT38_007636 [Cryptococcus sp. DSM 104549]
MAPAQLANAFIYLHSLIRPSILRPHLRVPSIANVDFSALKKEGYNAVVIDKDNCLTIPNKDDVYPPFQTAWNDLLSTFHAGRVLVVSNSAGTDKDPGSIAAEAVSLSLKAPVLLHRIPKPGCSTSILAYFQGKLGQPHTLRRDIASAGLRVWETEKEDEKALWARWNGEVEGPLLGGLTGSGGTVGKSLGEHVAEGHGVGPGEGKAQEKLGKLKEGKEVDQLRILVIGDRLFTDTLLANRLSLKLPTPPSQSNQAPTSLPSVLSIHTTSLPQPRDVRALRWIEDKLTRGLTKEGDFSRFVLREEELSPVTSLPPSPPSRWAALRWLTPARWREIEVPPLTWHPRSWRPLPLAAGAGTVALRATKLVWREGKRGGLFVWARGKRWVAERRAKAEQVEVAAEAAGASPGVLSGSGEGGTARPVV